MAVTLSLRETVQVPVEVDGLLPDRLRGLSIDSILRIELTQGNARLTVGDLFEVSGDCSDDLTLIWQGQLQGVKRIGQGLSTGRIVVEGPAGMHTGAGMTGGVIEVAGSAGDWAGAEMRGGLLRIRGSAGNCAGGAYRGSRRGMTGGELLIDGDAGHELGRLMRRGVIAVGGASGDFCGVRMIAGSIFIAGKAGRRTGAGMKRGTICLAGSGSPEPLPSFERAGLLETSFLVPYARRLRAAGFESLSSALTRPMERWCGDRLTRGLGEILTPAAAN